jgi:prepilin-type N-terminal cleavage/methylation domain-containing protein
MNYELRTTNYELRNNGFSLTEVLMAMGVLAVGMLFVAGIFPVGLYFAAVSTEQTIAAVAADEAFAKIEIYAEADPNIHLNNLKPTELKNFNDANDVFPSLSEFDPCELTYPSNNTAILEKRYCWSALCRLTDEPNSNPPVQVTVFVCRKTGANLKYPNPAGGGTVDWPVPVKVDVDSTGKDDELKIRRVEERNFINDGCTIVDNKTGRIYRVLERYASVPGKPADYDRIILLNRDLDDPLNPPQAVWVIPPAVGGGKSPCIAVYQKTIRF